MSHEDYFTFRGYQLAEQSLHHLSPSLEDYLEMIYRKITEQGHIRVSALAELLNVKPSSASKMLIKLKEAGLVAYEKYGVIQLTEQGQQMGEYLVWRHEVIKEFFALLSPDDLQTAFQEGELAEHILSKQTVESLARLNAFLRENCDVYQRLRQILES